MAQMSFSIPETKYTKAVCFCAGKLDTCGYGFVLVFMDALNKATKGDECIFFNTKYGFSTHKLMEE